MKLNKTKIDGVFLIELEKKEDERGYLIRTWCKKEFKDFGINFNPVQVYISFTKERGTVRGLHYQIEPRAEAKLTRCIKGTIYEVVLDLRSGSKTYKKWQGFKLSAADNKLLYVQKNVAHAILTLEDNTEFLNLSSAAYSGKLEKGIRFDDPAFKIKWPIKVRHISKKDMSWEDFQSL